jgi:KUP system potassium uptake protein
VFGLFGAALLYADGMITPAITVLGAVEGLEVAMPKLHTLIEPIAIAILIGVFLVQRHGTAKIGALFGPVMLVWFVVIAILGVTHIRVRTRRARSAQPTFWSAVSPN